jgi:hypothetical protein
MADLYEQMQQKAVFFRIAAKKIFRDCPAYKFEESDALFKGFFFLFVYKDFILRDLISTIKECLPKEKGIRVLDLIDKDYADFIESHLVEWVNLLLHCDVF